MGILSHMGDEGGSVLRIRITRARIGCPLGAGKASRGERGKDPEEKRTPQGGGPETGQSRMTRVPLSFKRWETKEYPTASSQLNSPAPGSFVPPGGFSAHWVFRPKLFLP
jgi:hypothetical protein